MKKIILLFLLMLTMLACINNSKEDQVHSIQKIDISGQTKPLNASKIFEDYKFVSLETTTNCLLNDVIKIVLKNNEIFIQDRNFQGLFIFSNSGKLKKKFFNYGKGPKEYFSLNDFIVDEEKRTIEVLDKTSKNIYIYDLDTYEFIEKIKLPLQSIYKFTKDTQCYYIQTNGMRNRIDGYSSVSEVFAFDKKKQKVKPLFVKDTTMFNNSFIEFPNIFYKNHAGKVYFSLLWNGKAYSASNGTLVDFIVFDSKTEKVPLDVVNGNYETKLAYLQSLEESKVIFAQRLLKYYKGNMVVTYQIGKTMPEPNYYISIGDGKERYFTNKIIFDLLEEFDPIEIELFQGSGGYLFSILYPHQYAHHPEFLKSNNIDLSDNPLILLLNFRKHES